jgi:pilus assembly protein Flp/PilA
MPKLVYRLWKDEDGVTAIEYGLIAALIAVVIIGSVTLLGTSLSGTFSTVQGCGWRLMRVSSVET